MRQHSNLSAPLGVTRCSQCPFFQPSQSLLLFPSALGYWIKCSLHPVVSRFTSADQVTCFFFAELVFCGFIKLNQLSTTIKATSVREWQEWGNRGRRRGCRTSISQQQAASDRPETCSCSTHHYSHSPLIFSLTESRSTRHCEGLGRIRPSSHEKWCFLPHAAEQSQTNVLCNIAHTNGTGLRRHRGTVSAVCCQLVRNSAGKKVHSSSQLPWAAGVKPTGSPADTI